MPFPYLYVEYSLLIKYSGKSGWFTSAGIDNYLKKQGTFFFYAQKQGKKSSPSKANSQRYISNQERKTG